MTSPTPRADWWSAYGELLDAVGTAVLALAAWSGLAVAAAVLADALADVSWPYLFVLPLGLVGAGLSLTSRAEHVRGRIRRGQDLPG